MPWFVAPARYYGNEMSTLVRICCLFLFRFGTEEVDLPSIEEIKRFLNRRNEHGFPFRIKIVTGKEDV